MDLEGELSYFLVPKAKKIKKINTFPSSQVSGEGQAIHFQNVSVTNIGPNQASTLLGHLCARRSTASADRVGNNNDSQKIIPFERKKKNLHV